MSKLRRKQNSLQYYVPLSLFAVVIVIITSFSYNETWFFNWEGIRPEIKDSISDHNYIHIFKRRVDLDPKILNKRGWLISYANDYELLSLTKFPNGNVKAVAYEGLLKSKTYKEKYQLMLASFKENYSVIYISECRSQSFRLSDFLMNHVLMQKGKKDSVNNYLDYGITESEMIQLQVVRIDINTKLD